MVGSFLLGIALGGVCDEVLQTDKFRLIGGRFDGGDGLVDVRYSFRIFWRALLAQLRKDIHAPLLNVDRHPWKLEFLQGGLKLGGRGVPADPGRLVERASEVGSAARLRTQRRASSAPPTISGDQLGSFGALACPFWPLLLEEPRRTRLSIQHARWLPFGSDSRAVRSTRSSKLNRHLLAGHGSGVRCTAVGWWRLGMQACSWVIDVREFGFVPGSRFKMSGFRSAIYVPK